MELESKSLPITSFEAGAKGEFTANVAMFGNVDRVGDRIMPPAFDDAIAHDAPPPIIYNHNHDQPPIGETIDWKATTDGLQIKGGLFVDGDDEHPMAKMVYAGMKSRGGRPPALRDFSFVYGVPEGGAKNLIEDRKSIRELYTIRPVAEVGPCLMGVNPEAGTLQAPKSYAAWFAAKHNAPKLKLPPEVVQAKGLLEHALEGKSWDDIDAYETGMLLDMLDDSVSYISAEQDSGNVASMKTIAGALLSLVDAKLAEMNDEAGGMALVKSAWGLVKDVYVKAADLPAMSSEAGVTVMPGAVAALLLHPSSFHSGG